MDDLAKAYLETEIVLVASDGFLWAAVSIDAEGSVSRSGGLLGLLNLETSSALIITACNPLSQRLRPEQNDQLQSELIDDLEDLGFTYIEVIGQEPGGGWSEESLLIPSNGSPDNLAHVVNLARKYKQNAIFELTESTKKVIGVCMSGIDGEVGYRLLQLVL